MLLYVWEHLSELSSMYEPQEKRKMIIQLNSNCYYQKKRIISILFLSLSFSYHERKKNIVIMHMFKYEKKGSSKSSIVFFYRHARVCITINPSIMSCLKNVFHSMSLIFFSVMVDWYMISIHTKKKEIDKHLFIFRYHLTDKEKKSSLCTIVFIPKLKSIQEICRQTCLKQLLMHFFHLSRSILFSFFF